MAKITIKKVFEDFKKSAKYYSKLFKEIEKDFEFTLGKQWDDADIEKLRGVGVQALTINKLKPLIRLITGIERQSRSDLKAFPEGVEDEVLADISTRLIKNVIKQSRAERKQSDMFKHGIIGGISYLEPFMDYTYDLLNGDMKFRKVSAQNIYPDPNGEEYDLSDRRYLIKFTPNLSKDQLLEMFPEDEKKIDDIGKAKINLDDLSFSEGHIQREDYPTESNVDGDELLDEGYDLIEYYYKEPINKYYVADRELGTLKEASSKEEADGYAEQFENSVVIKKKVPEIRVLKVVGDVEFSDEVCWSFPQWKSFPFIPYFADWITEDLKDADLTIQGIARGLRDLQAEYNKRRTQSLRHINSSINSGHIVPKGTFDARNKAKIRKYGSSPGIFIEYDTEKAAGTTPQQWRVFPQPISQGHEQLAAENAQDIKEASGVNSDLLANDSQSQSGRAILLKQRQGLVMIQEALDNYSDTKKILGKFILSQLGEVHTVETAVRVVGESWINDQSIFKAPVHEITNKALQKAQEGGELSAKEQELLQRYPQASAEQPAVDPTTNKLILEVDHEIVGQVFNKVLNDTALGKYDVTIGEGVFSETVKIANYNALLEMAAQGVPISPQIIIENSLLSPADKEKIIKDIEAQQEQQLAQVKAPQQQGALK